jgi:hypothetical protein
VTVAWFSPVLRAFAGLPARVQASRLRRAQELALSILADAPAHRLAELGIDVSDVEEALRRRGKR